MSGRTVKHMPVRRWWWVAALGVVVSGCRTTGSAARDEANASATPRQEIQFDAVTVTADLELDKLNDEELFAGGTSAFAANEFQQAARYFGRLADFFPDSPHRRKALYNAGLSHQRLKEWEEAGHRFSELADPARGQDDALDAAFRVAELDNHLERYEQAAKALSTIAARTDVPVTRRLEAQVQQGICQLESGAPETAETTLRKALSTLTARAPSSSAASTSSRKKSAVM